MIDVLYLKVTNKEWFKLSLKTIQQHLLNCGRIYILQTNLNLNLFEDVSICNQSLIQFMNRLDITLRVIIIDLNMGLLKDINSEHIPITYEINNKIYKQDYIKPQPINKKEFAKLSDQEYEYPLRLYYKSIDRIGVPNNPYVVYVTKPLCCTVKSLMTIKQYVIWNEKSFDSVKNYLNKE